MEMNLRTAEEVIVSRRFPQNEHTGRLSVLRPTPPYGRIWTWYCKKVPKRNKICINFLLKPVRTKIDVGTSFDSIGSPDG